MQNQQGNPKQQPQRKEPLKPKKTKPKKAKAARVLLVTLCVIALLAGLVWAIWSAILDHYLSKVNIVTKETDLVFQTEPIEPVNDSPDLHGTVDKKNLPLICNTKDVTNILLLGTDSRTGDAGLSDSMMIVSINDKTGKIIVCSLLRDIWATYPALPKNPIGEGRQDKLNHSHSYGGPELTMAVIKETFNIEVNQYARINFTSFVDIIDAMGGIDIEISSQEAWWINLYVTSEEMAEIFPKYPKTGVPATGGMLHLNGLQALGHARDRRIGSDFARTERQRTILNLMMQKAKNLSLSELDNLLDVTLPLITTNIQKQQLKKMVNSLPTYLSYEMISTRLPQQGLYTDVDYNMVLVQPDNSNYLYQLIYEEESPTVSANKKK